jgi:hypothetical protein
LAIAGNAKIAETRTTNPSEREINIKNAKLPTERKLTKASDRFAERYLTDMKKAKPPKTLSNG